MWYVRTNRRTPKMTRKKKSSSCYGSTGNMSHVEVSVAFWFALITKLLLIADWLTYCCNYYHRQHQLLHLQGQRRGMRWRQVYQLAGRLSTCMMTSAIVWRRPRWVSYWLLFWLLDCRNLIGYLKSHDVYWPIAVEVVRPLPGDFNPAYVTKWVDYSNKYGFGFQMSDGTVGVLFNSKSWMTLSPSGRYTTLCHCMVVHLQHYQVF